MGEIVVTVQRDECALAAEYRDGETTFRRQEDDVPISARQLAEILGAAPATEVWLDRGLADLVPLGVLRFVDGAIILAK